MKKVLRFLTLAAMLCIPWVTQAQQSLPYSYGFENNNLATDGWLLSGATSSSTGISSDAAQNGSYGFLFNYSEQNAYLLSPVLTGTTNGVVLSFYYAEYSSSYGDEQFYVGYTTDETNTDPSTYTYGPIVTASTAWQMYEETLPAGTKRVAIQYVYNDAFYLYLDDFTFDVPPACPDPTALAAADLTTNSATLGWTSGASNFNVRYRTALIENPFFFEDFESGLADWTIYTDGDAPQSNGWYTVNPVSGLSFEAHSVSNCASSWSWNSSAYDADNWLVSPQVPLTGTLKFWVRTNAGYPDSYEVLLSTTTNDESAFTVTLQAMAAAPAVSEWTEVSIDLSAYSGNGYIAIHHVDNDNNYLLIDDFGIYDTPTPAGSWTNATANTNSLAISGLSTETTYDFEVQADCGSDGTSNWVASTFTTNPSCMPVSNLAVDAATTTTITLSWTDNNSGAATYVVTDNDDNPVTITGLTTTGCTITGLTANTAYTFKVKANCGGYSTAESIDARTACDAITTLPYNESFEGDGFYCWTLDGFTGLNNSTYAHTGNKSIYVQGNTGAVYAILPATSSDISGLMLNFWWQNAYSGYDLGSLEVGYLTDVADYTTFVSVGTIDMSNSSDVYVQSIDYVFDGAPVGAQITLKYIGGTSGAILIIDDVTIDVRPACMNPNNLSVTGGMNAVLTWDGSASSYDIAYSTSSTATPADVIIATGVTTNTFDLSSYTNAGDNFVWVRANCGTNGYSEWVAASFNVDYCTPNPTSHDGSGITAVSFGTGSYVVNNGDGTASLPASSPFYGDYTSMIGAVNAGVESTIAITTSTGSYPYTFVIWVDLDNSMTFEDSEVLYVGKAASGNGTLNATITIPAIQALGDYRMRIYGADSYFTSFYGNGTTNWSAAHDPCASGTYRHAHDYTLRVLEAPSCLAPTGLAATPAATQAELSWTPNSGETSWTLYYKKTSESSFTAVPNVTDNPYTLTSLASASDYVFYVVANCTSGDSDPSAEYNFSTLCEAFTITAVNKYTQDFESPVVTSTYSSTTGLKVPNCWDNPYTTGSSAAGNPHLVAAGASYNYASSNQVLLFYGSGSNYVTLPEFTNDLNTLQISFKWATESDSYGTLTLGYITDGDVNYSTFTEIASYPASASSYHTLLQAGPVELDALPATAKRLAFRWVYSGQYSCNVDDVLVELIPSCKIPTALTCTGYTATTATFSWTPNGGNQTAWQLYISESNSAPADDIDENLVINANTNPFTVTSGLVAEHTYYAWVRGNCSASSEGYSEWSESIEFMPSRYKNFTYQENASSSTSYVPFYGYYANNATNKGQILIPASNFPADMGDATVRRLTFYTTNSYANVEWGSAEFDVLVAEVPATSFASAAFIDWGDMTTVYSGTLSVSNQEMVINLDAPFTYTGGNLLIGFNLTTTGTGASVYWVATYGSTNLGAYQYGTSSVSRTYYQPKITFNYLPSATPRPTNLHTTEVLSREATLAWTAPYGGNATGYEYQYKLATSDSWSAAATTTGLNVTIDELTPEKTYDFRLRAIYSGPEYSQYATTQFTTVSACETPDGLAATNVSSSSATITWNTYGLTEFNLRYKTGSGDWMVQNNVAQPYTFVDPLTANAAYQVQVQATCAADPENDWSTVLNFSTPCDAIDITAATPYIEDFEAPVTTAVHNTSTAADVVVPDCWLHYTDNASYVYAKPHLIKSGANYNYSAGQVLYFYGSGNGYAALPMFSNDWSELQISFKWATESSSYGTLTLGYITDEDVNYNTFTEIKSYPASSASYQTLVQAEPVYLGGLPANATRLVFRWYYSSWYGANVDDVKVSLLTKDIAANQWYAIASPTHNSGVDMTVAGVDNLTSGTYDLLRYNETAGRWESQKAGVAPFNTLEQGRGYIYRRSTAATLTFVGQGNTGAVSRSITHACSDLKIKGFNLVGNPYPLAYAPTRAFYTLQANGTWMVHTASPSNKVAAGEGFFIYDNSNATYAFAEPSGAKGAPRSSAAAIAFTVSNDEYSDVAYATFNDGEGMPKMAHLNSEAPALSIPQGDRHYAIANLDENTERFPLHFVGTGEYTLTVSDMEDLGYLHLIDRATGRDIDLLATPEYTFHANGSGSDRFTVRLMPGIEENGDVFFVRLDGSRLIVDGEGELQVFDVMGRQLGSAQVSGTATLDRHSLGMVSAGVYVMRLDGNSQKIVVK